MEMITSTLGKARKKYLVLAGALAMAVVLILSVCLTGQALAAQKECSVLFICEEYPLWGPMGGTEGILPEGAWSIVSDYLTRHNFSLSRKNLKPIKYEDICGYDVVVYSPLWRYKEEGGFIKHGFDVTFSEPEALVKYVKNGGNLLIFSDENDGEGFSNLNTFTEKYFGIKFLPGVVLSNSRNFYTIDFKSHSITTGFTKLRLVNEVGALEIQQPAKSIAYTSSNCWLNSEAWNHAREQGPDDRKGPFPVMAVTQYGNGKVIGIADDDWVVGWEPDTDEYKKSQKLFLNILGWLSGKTGNTDELKSQPSATHEPSNKSDKDTPPNITIKKPLNGNIYKKGNNIEIEAQATDNLKVEAMGLYVTDPSGKEIKIARVPVKAKNYTFKYTLKTDKFKDGKYVIKVTAVDPSNNFAFKTVDILFNVTKLGNVIRNFDT